MDRPSGRHRLPAADRPVQGHRNMARERTNLPGHDPVAGRMSCHARASHALAVLAKRPVPGRVKTRLSPPFTPEQAAALAGAALQDTLAAVSATGVRRRLLVFDG